MPNSEFLFALHKNDLVQTKDGSVYRVQKIESSNVRLMLRSHLASVINNKEQEIYKSISTLMQEFEIKPLSVNSIGKVIGD